MQETGTIWLPLKNSKLWGLPALKGDFWDDRFFLRGAGFGLWECASLSRFFLRTGLEHVMMSSRFAVKIWRVNQVSCHYWQGRNSRVDHIWRLKTHKIVQRHLLEPYLNSAWSSVRVAFSAFGELHNLPIYRTK